MSLSIENRNKTFFKIKYGLSKRRGEVYLAIQDIQCGKATIEEVCSFLNKPKNEVSGRISELKSLYLIREFGSNKSSKNHSQTIYSIVENEKERYDLMIEDLHEQKRRLENLDYNLQKVTGFTNDLVVKERDKVKTKINQIEKLLK